MTADLADLSYLISEMSKASKLEDIMRHLHNISSSGYKNATYYSRSKNYIKAAEEYGRIASAYNKAIDLVGKESGVSTRENSAYLKTVTELLTDSSSYWEKQAEIAISDNIIHETSNEINQAKDLLNKGLYKEAIELFDQALEKRPFASTYEIWTGKGTAYFNLNRFNESYECYKRALEIQPNYAEAWSNLANSLYELRRNEEAIKSYNKALSINPKESNAWIGMGNAYYFLTEYDKANACYDTAISLTPLNDIPWYNKAQISSDLGNYEESERFYKRAMELNPNSIDIKANLAEILLFRKKYAESEALIEGVISQTLDSKYAFPMGILTICSMYLQNRESEGRQTVDDLLAYHETNVSASSMNLSAWSYIGLKKILSENRDLNLEKKEFLVSLISLAEAKEEQYKKVALKRTKDLLERMDTSILNMPTEPLVRKDVKSNIKTVNTSTLDENKRDWYKWEVHLEGPARVLNMIKTVKYILHPTFLEREVVINDRGNNFRLDGSGWGEFLVTIEITLSNDDRILRKYHWLRLQ